MDPLELDFNHPVAQKSLYEDVLIRKKSLESLNSITGGNDEDNWNNFNRINNNNSFIVENQEPDSNQDKEMLPDVEMFDQQPQQLTAENAGKVEATQDVIVSDGTKTQKSIWLGRKTKTAETKKPAIKRLSKKIEKPPKKVPIKKLQVEEKKKARKQKAEEAKELKKMHQSTAGQAEIASTDI